MNGKEVATRLFGQGKKGGPEWRAAKEWEEETRKKLGAGGKIRTDLEQLFLWLETYLKNCERSMSEKTLVEKKLVMKDFIAFCRTARIRNIKGVDTPKVFKFLTRIHDDRGPKVANKYRKNLLAAWNWGSIFMDDFPQVINPFKRITPFSASPEERYVPSEEDIIKVLQQAEGQDLVMLLTFYYTGARRGEVFKLTWKDINLKDAKIRLVDHKSRVEKERIRWLQMHPVLVDALIWWKKARPAKVNNVFMQVQSEAYLGLPFTQRRNFLERLCKRAGVKPFGFHALRHKSAAITFEASGLSAAQILMGHYRATTTDRYVRSAGLYNDQSGILSALENSMIGKTVDGLVKTKISQDLAS
ncbi:MAG: site-specific integrase [Mailhella sp.]|nr:site-specific integrase [Mailhella sp.]